MLICVRMALAQPSNLANAVEELLPEVLATDAHPKLQLSPGRLSLAALAVAGGSLPYGFLGWPHSRLRSPRPLKRLP